LIEDYITCTFAIKLENMKMRNEMLILECVAFLWRGFGIGHKIKIRIICLFT